MISGQWQGTVESLKDGPGTLEMHLVQTGTNVTGALTLSQGGVSDVAGSLTGTLVTGAAELVLQYSVTYEYGDRCQGTFTGTATLSGDQELMGPYEGHDCGHEFTGTLHVTRNR